MKLREFFIFSTLCLLITFPLQAQELVQLNASELTRLGIVIIPVSAVDDSIGASFPATVINSPLTISTLTIPYAGILQSWHIEPGEQVQGGDILINIRSQALLDLQNDWRNARHNLEQQNFELEKDSTLLNEGIIARQRFSQTQRNYQQAEDMLQTLTAKLSLAGYSGDPLISADEIDSEPGMYAVRSPVNGSVDHLMLTAGAYADANTAIASIGNNDRWLSAQLPARIANRLEIGQILRVAGNNIPLTLRQKDHAIDPQSQTVEVFAAFSSLPNLMTGQIVTLLIPPTVAGVLIPAAAVVHSGDETTVYIHREGSFEARSLNLSPAGADYMATDGIVIGEQVVIRGAAILKGIQLGLGGE
ncbi:MAG: hypothetical protein COA71_03925 [SAR86 cluster bacterium]|uniref:Uncharacterized protein n=1 Tax=SAR86 cluster bacterium TaxID=2030880 RepID=A0A2A5CFW8_9GAMM|nr:efflux RND transporter periplasmic adaptor subunit [Gammaproteobacteria bacterium AH-315-E17]PCJ42662.1 MAG: hypothetical protein COA71_03925 [SAR86 cluster bacterium]